MAAKVLNGAQSGLMTDHADEAREIRARRLRHGMSINQLHKASGVSRDGITAAENGTASELTYHKLESWFTAFETEVGDDSPEVELWSVEVSDEKGVRVVVKGPSGDRDGLAEFAARLIREMRGRRD